MKSKHIIFILFLLIVLASGLVVFLTKEKIEPIAVEQPSVNEQSAVITEQVEQTAVESAEATSTIPAQVVQTEIKEEPEAINIPAEEKIKVEMIISGVKFETAIKLDSSVYDLMDLLKTENKINFFGKNYSSLGFFVEEINGIKNNPSGKNWLYYVNGQPAQVGISNYLIKENDVIEWKYKNKSF